MKKIYEEPIIEIQVFTSEDIMDGSTMIDDGDENTGGEGTNRD